MPNILILGGTGFLGLTLGQALVRSGNHSVYATTRSADRTKMLMTNEITPLVGEAKDEAFLLKTISDYRIDTVVDTTQAYYDATAILASVVKAAKDRAAILAQGGSVGPKLGFVYTSGTWVHGSPGKTRISDTTVPGTSLSPDKPATAVSWRPAHEQAVLAARDVLDVAILRPFTIYGRASWVMDTWWGAVLAAAESDSTEPVAIPADRETMVGLVHVDDLATAYVAVIDRLAMLGSWPVFDLGTETLPLPAIMESVAGILGAKGELVYAGTQGNPFFKALALVSNTTSARARAILGWSPARREFLRDLPTLVAAWRASKQ